MQRLIIIALASTILAGCANTDIYSGNVYTSEQAKQTQTVTYGTVTNIRPVKIQAGDENNVLGTIGGAVVGGVLGSTVGGGKGQTLAATAGALAGGLAGNKIQDSVSKTDALEMEIRKKNGDIIVVVQKAKPGEFQVGQEVRIANRGSVTTVSPR